VNDTLPDVPPPGVGLVTVTVAVPPLAMSEALIAACKLVLETNVVGRTLPFHRTVDEETKFVPVIVNVKAGLPSSSTFGLSEVTVGTGLLIVKVSALDIPPPGLGLETVTIVVPAVAMSAAIMSACRLVLETNVVVRELPFHRTVDEEIKLAPVTASVKEAVPALAELGLRVPDASEGTRLFGGGGGGLPELPPHPQTQAEDTAQKITPQRANTDRRNRGGEGTRWLVIRPPRTPKSPKDATTCNLIGDPGRSSGPCKNDRIITLDELERKRYGPRPGRN
jgi:hypothetical protein